MSEEDQFCENSFCKTIQRQPDGRYVVSLPFKREFSHDLHLGSSRKLCLKRFILSENRLKKTPLLEAEYNNSIREYLDVDHMKKVTSNEIILENNFLSYYLPHHAVVKPESTTTRLRVVFNASSPSQNGISLNDVLYIGPSLQQDLLMLILRWRTHRYVFNADVAKMYRQIRINPSQTQYQRILFRTHPENSIEDFELQTVTFGVNCAPYLAIRTLLKLADDEEHNYPLGSKLLRNDFYVDDLLSGADTLQQCLQLQTEIISILESAGFVLRKWTANDRVLLENVPKEHILADPFLNIAE